MFRSLSKYYFRTHSRFRFTRMTSTYTGKKTIQLASDLHLENYPNPKLRDFITPNSPNLALVGDIGIPYMPSYAQFIEECSKEFENTYLITGNHEYYQHKNKSDDILTMDETNNKIKEITQKYKNIHYLDNKSANLYDYTILGTTLWSFLPIENRLLSSYLMNSMNDYRTIFKSLPTGIKTEITDKDTTVLHLDNYMWLMRSIQPDKKYIILSHHLPSFKLIAPQYKNSPLNPCFASNLDHLMTSNVKYWFSGHTHTAMKKTINGCQCVVNPFGYSGENGKNGYCHDLTITLE